jgi:methyl acetate hydrolase
MKVDASTIDGLLQQGAKARSYPGAALVITDRDGVLYRGGAGTLRSGGGPAVDDRTMFRYASTTKAVASVAALQLVEQGRLNLDAEVSSLLPEFGKLQVLESFDGDEPILRAPKRQATVRQLLSHSSGLSYFFTNATLAKYHKRFEVPDVLSGNRAALFVPMVHDPGTIWEYGTNTDWLGLVVEKLAGQTLARYLAEHVTGPLGMTDTTFQPTAEQRARIMPVHARTADGGLTPTPMELPEKPDWWAGGHGLYGTAGDYGRFVRMLLRGGELDGARVLQEATVDLAFSDALNGVPMPTNGITSVVPELSNDVPLLPFRQTWGLGFHLTLEDVPGMRKEGTGDWAGLFNLYYWVDRRSGIGCTFLTQVLPFFDHHIIATFGAIEVATYAGLAA